MLPPSKSRVCGGAVPPDRRQTNLQRSTAMLSEWLSPLTERHEAENVSLTKTLMIVQVSASQVLDQGLSVTLTCGSHRRRKLA